MDETAQPVGQRSRSARLGAGGGQRHRDCAGGAQCHQASATAGDYLGSVGAIAVRSWLTMVVVWLSQVPGWMLLWRRDFGMDRPPPAWASRR